MTKLEPPRAKVFVSHSSDDESIDDEAVFARNLRDELAKALSNAGLDVLLDQSKLRSGDSWRQLINGWVGDSDAAIVIFSQKARRSEWVRYEASVLCFRHFRENDPFELHPIWLCDLSELSWAAEDPTQVREIQGTVVDAENMKPNKRDAEIARVVGLVVEALGQLEPSGNYPIETSIRRLQKLLNGSDDDTLKDEATRLETVFFDGWTPYRAPSARLAAALLAAGLEKAGESLRAVRGKLPAHEFRDTIDLLASSWVNEESLCALTESGRGALRVGSSIRRGEAVNFFMWAHGDLPPSESSLAVPVVVNSGASDEEGQYLALENATQEALEEEFSVDSREEVRQKIRDMAKYGGRRVFLVLQKRSVTEGHMKRIQEAYPQLGFFLIEYSHRSSRGSRLEMEIVPLLPDVTKETEDAYLEIYRGSKNALDL